MAAYIRRGGVACPDRQHDTPIVCAYDQIGDGHRQQRRDDHSRFSRRDGQWPGADFRRTCTICVAGRRRRAAYGRRAQGGGSMTGAQPSAASFPRKRESSAPPRCEVWLSLDSRLRAGLSGEIEGEWNRQERSPRKNNETSRVLRRLLIVETQKRARKSQTPRRHRGERASRPSRLRRSLRCASRALTRARLDGLLQPRRFADRNGHTAGFGQQNVLVANSHAERSPSPAGAKRSGAPVMAPHGRISLRAYLRGAMAG